MQWQYFWDTRDTIPKGVGMGSYTVGHLCWLAVTVLVCAGAALLYRRLSEKGRNVMLWTLTGLMLANEISKYIMLMCIGEMKVDYLPLHLCSINIFVCLFYAIRRRDIIAELLYCLCIPGAVLALVMPSWNSLPVLNYMSIHSFTIHIELLLFPILLLVGGYKPSYKLLPKSALCLVCVAPFIYVLNKLWVTTNFMFLNWPEPGTPLVWFAKYLGNPGYILGMPVMAAAIWLVMYLPWVIAGRKAEARTR